MPDNLSSRLNEYLPQQVLTLIRDAGIKASKLGLDLFLVGGAVRDLFLDRGNFDLDLVVEGDAIGLARELARNEPVKLTAHARFGTARLNFNDFSLDLATARRESYEKPGALPTVSPGTINDDLRRRDFSINAMAVCLTPERFGELIDLYHGKEDIDHRLVRVLHPDSFIDDATRIFRALRYKQRLDFALEPITAELLVRDAVMIDTISGDRIRHELELILREGYPELVLKLAREVGALSKLHQSLRADDWLVERFERARQLYRRRESANLYLCLLVYSLTVEENEQFLSHLNFPKRQAQTMRQTLYLKAQLHRLDTLQIMPSDVYQLLCNYMSPAIQANMLASESKVVQQHLQSYLARLRYIRPILTGDDLIVMGIPPGPELGEALAALYKAKLNREVKTRRDEEKLVYSWQRSS